MYQVCSLANRSSCVHPETKPSSLLPDNLAQIVKMRPEKLVDQLGLNQSIRQQFVMAASALPNVDIAITATTALDLGISITRRNNPTNSDFRIYATRFPKPQTEGYFVLVVDPARDEIIGLKRLGWSAAAKGSKKPFAKVDQSAAGDNAGHSRTSAKTSLKLPGSESERRLDVHVISDAYPGLRGFVKGVEIPAVPSGGDDLKKNKESAQ